MQESRGDREECVLEEESVEIKPSSPVPVIRRAHQPFINSASLSAFQSIKEDIFSFPPSHHPHLPAGWENLVRSSAFSWRLFISCEGQPCRKSELRNKNNFKGCRRH